MESELIWKFSPYLGKSDAVYDFGNSNRFKSFIPIFSSFFFFCVLLLFTFILEKHKWRLKVALIVSVVVILLLVAFLTAWRIVGK